jgi:hypothetical protein
LAGEERGPETMTLGVMADMLTSADFLGVGKSFLLKSNGNKVMDKKLREGSGSLDGERRLS